MQSCIFIMTVSLIFCVLQLNVSPPNRLCRRYAFETRRGSGFPKRFKLSQLLKCCFSQSTGLRSSKKFNNMITGSRCGHEPHSLAVPWFWKVRNMGYCGLNFSHFSERWSSFYQKSMSRYKAVAFSHHTPSRPFQAAMDTQ